MIKWFNTQFWSSVSRLILRNRVLLLLFLLTATIFLSFQWKHMRFSFTEANLLPDDHAFNIEYQKFVDIFGDEGNLMVLAIKD